MNNATNITPYRVTIPERESAAYDELATEEIRAKLSEIVEEAGRVGSVVHDKKSIRELTDEQLEQLCLTYYCRKVDALFGVLEYVEDSRQTTGRFTARVKYHYTLDGERIDDEMAGKVQDAQRAARRMLPGWDGFPMREMARKEETRRRRNATIAANKAEKAKGGSPRDLYEVNEIVEVHAMGHWYKGTVLRFNRNGRAIVEYTSGSGVTREKTVSNDKIRKPDGLKRACVDLAAAIQNG